MKSSSVWKKYRISLTSKIIPEESSKKDTNDFGSFAQAFQLLRPTTANPSPNLIIIDVCDNKMLQ